MEFLASPRLDPAPVIRLDDRAIVLDLGAGSLALGEPLADLPVERFSELVDRAMAAAGTGYALGRWAERREIYSSVLFAEADPAAERRSVHLGVDVFCAAGTPVHAPLDGRVHIKANNAAELDYGPLLVLEHATPGGEAFHTLYGHLGSAGCAHVRQGQAVRRGERIATVGSPPENGNWPPHLHLQLILDLLELGADFPGVARPAELDRWLALSPSPAMFFPGIDAAALDGRKASGS
ncbi:MAG: peptidoglycan DD-metalloendopeptidase family protein [Gammaproteobacteria bacterium]|nr:peptidoglycan DD-metalloendopeptidase family protein [Gammaproteobacteria bacterium]MDH5310961.1 peptidoglycan DD-metalloendopeptidase family protein [Gammaproteobacteria bacterium]